MFASARPSLGSQLKHGATCDCFIAPLQSRSTLDELLQILTNEIANVTTFAPNVPVVPSSNVTAPEPKLIVIKPPAASRVPEGKSLRQSKNRFVQPTPKPLNGPLSIDDLYAFLEESQQKLKSFGWLPSNYTPLRPRPLHNDPINRSMRDDPTDTDPTSLFSLKHGFVSRNLMQAGRLMQLFDKFDCRCAGDFGRIIDAKKFVRFTVSHV
uniref:Uncharacterized protein n=1 Tax=Panagrellus redivivus TaxID=6233 RepID=A0A7E4VKG0_PANRE